MKQKLLYVDGLNYSEQFGFTTKRWNLTICRQEIDKFVTACTKDGWTLTIFIDGGIESSEALKKWKSRREQEILTETKAIIQSTSVLMGDLFREKGVQVYYSPWNKDNDDILATIATRDGASILSNDGDFFRYNDRTYRQYGSFKYEDDTIILVEKKQNTKRESPAPRNLLPEVPKLSDRDTLVDILKNLELFRRGCPSNLVKLVGNPYSKLTKVRSAAYFYLGIKLVTEEWPEWNRETLQVQWHCEEVRAQKLDNNGNLQMFLEDNNVEAIYQCLFQDINLPNDDSIEEYEIQNHISACKIIIAETIALYKLAKSGEVLNLATLVTLNGPNDPEKLITNFCTNYLRDGNCSFAERCFAKESHIDCKFFAAGKCRRGQHCRFYHRK